jgi:hypothetical protein
MKIIVCPGIHKFSLTECFLKDIFEQESCQGFATNLLVFPADRYPAYSGLHILCFLYQRLSRENPNLFLQMPLIWIGFSAGVVGSITAAWMWQWLGGRVQAVIALDGWGVPLGGNFPVHRLSHDRLTHWSSALLGAGQDSFYSDPAIDHLDLWRSPRTAQGWQIRADPLHQPTQTTAADFLTALLHHYAKSDER